MDLKELLIVDKSIMINFNFGFYKEEIKCKIIDIDFDNNTFETKVEKEFFDSENLKDDLEYKIYIRNGGIFDQGEIIKKDRKRKVYFYFC